MLPNTYIKIITPGIDNIVEGLPGFGASERIIPLGEDRDVEVRRDKTREGLIVIIRRNNNEVDFIHTQGQVFIQEGRETISANLPVTPFVLGVTEEGDTEVTYPSTLDNPFVMPVPFEATMEGDVRPEDWNYTFELITLFNALSEEVIRSFDYFDRIFIKVSQSYLTSTMFEWLQNELNTRYGLNLTPLGGGEQECFVLEAP